MTARQSGAQGGITDRALDTKLAARNLRMPKAPRITREDRVAVDPGEGQHRVAATGQGAQPPRQIRLARARWPGPAARAAWCGPRRGGR